MKKLLQTSFQTARTAEAAHKQARRWLKDTSQSTAQTADSQNKQAQKHVHTEKWSLTCADTRWCPGRHHSSTLTSPETKPAKKKWSLTQADAQWIVAQWLLSSLTQSA